MATKNASNHQGQVKDPEHDGRLKGHTGGEAPKAHAEGTHPDEKGHAEPKKTAAAKKHEDEAAHEEHAKKAPAKSHKEPAHEEPKKAAASKDEPAKDAPAKGGASAEDADLKSREYTDAQGNVHHHTKAYMESHKGE
ncbi:hypothetical protein D3273_01830 [Lichenibacterium minor]|jgi:hypothetical protein|uniref:Uncharacterized protein n=1 Tax=Lichenibacterium minor TaxID=2316528 RepID=A0A4V1RVA9_9HYPH|nr:hypothetical protein [Lichenibacterium minor]RYC34014.1 hypothetical protein D3273_01830 [Lichenibacterium minor]